MATTARKPAAKKKSAKPQTPASAHAQKQMWAVVLFALGLLLAALTLIEGAKLWLWLHNLVLGVFGWSAFVLPPLMLYVAVIAALDRPLSTIRHKVWQVLVLIVLVSGVVQLHGSGIPEEKNFFETLPVLFNQGKALSGGGACSAVFAAPLVALFDTAGAKIILWLSVFVFAMLVTGSTLIGLFQTAKKPVQGLEDAYAASIENRQRRAAQNTIPDPGMPPHFAFDVDISKDKPLVPVPQQDMPQHPITSEKPTARERLMNAFGSPVEHIEPEEFAPPPTTEFATGPVPEPARRHALDDEILRAGEAEEDEIGGIVGRFLESVSAGEPGAADAVFIPSEPEIAEIPAREEPPAIPYEYAPPSVSLLQLPRTASAEDISEELRTNAEKLVDTLKSFGVQTRILDICRGPAVTRYELQPSAGVKISKITGLADDIALNLASAGIRIEAPIPNKAAVGIEVPNKTVSIVSIREILDSPIFQNESSNLTVALGRDIAGNIRVANLAGMPHMLIAGSTGSGKSVCINSIIISLLYKAPPDKVKLLMVDPKVVELGVYNGIPHLLVPVVTDPKKAAGALNWAVAEMQRRYRAFADQGVRNLAGYNQLAEESPDEELKPMPQIVIIIDELADLMMAAPGEVEDAICRLAQLARAAGMHLVIATQRPSVDIITGVIKANIPSRVAFAVSSQVDSRTILDMGGAEKLLGRGDMLFYPLGEVKPLRVQGCFVTDAEVERVVEFVKRNASEYDPNIAEEIDRHAIAEKSNGKKDKDDGGGFNDEDEMLPMAVECVVEAGQASTSLLQRRLKLGYARAARIVDQLEERGIVGPSEGSKPRQVLISKDRWLEMKMSGAENDQISRSKEFAQID